MDPALNQVQADNSSSGPCSLELHGSADECNTMDVLGSGSIVEVQNGWANIQVSVRKLRANRVSERARHIQTLDG